MNKETIAPVVYHAFPALCGKNPRAIILGTFPSPLSREKGEYYGNPRNQFWRLLFGAFGVAYDNPDYEKKKSVLFDNHIALCDVITACEVNGALDSGIRAPVFYTALPEFINMKGIRQIFFNGNNAYQFYRRNIGPVERNVLPSSSPAHARMRFEEKLLRWRELLQSQSHRQ